MFSSQIVSPVDDVLQAHRRADIARENFLDVFAFIGVHLHQTPDALPAVLGDVKDAYRPRSACPNRPE